MLLRYSIFNSIFFFVVAVLCYFYQIHLFVWEKDPTRIFLILFAAYCALTVYLGIMIKKKPDFSMVQFFSHKFPELGLVGTILGTIFMLIAAGNAVSAPETLAVSLLGGMAPVLMTTGGGIGFMFLLDLQVWFVFNHKNS